MGEAVIRPYEPGDRDAVRRICFDTGYMGDSVGWTWPDRESFADLFSAWYTDHEPTSALVVDDGGEVVGYLLGCRDSRRMPAPTGPIRRHLLRRGLAVRPATAPSSGDARSTLPSPLLGGGCRNRSSTTAGRRTCTSTSSARPGATGWAAC